MMMMMIQGIGSRPAMCVLVEWFARDWVAMDVVEVAGMPYAKGYILVCGASLQRLKRARLCTDRHLCCNLSM
jgi:hypothetical protein